MKLSDIQKNLATWTGFLPELNKDRSKSQSADYSGILNGLKHLEENFESLKGIANIQSNDVICRRIDDIEKLSREIKSFIFKSINSPTGTDWMMSLEHLNSLIIKCKELSKDLANLPAVPLPGSGKGKTPTDLMTLTVTKTKYKVHPSTIRRAIKAGHLINYQTKTKSQNALILVSESQIRGKYPPIK